MEAMRKGWTDERLDGFREGVERRFDEVDRRFDEVDRRFGEVDRRLGNVDRRLELVDDRLLRIDDRIDSMAKAIIYGSLAMSSAMVAGFVAILAQL